MAFDLGAIWGKLRLDITEFLQNLGKASRASEAFQTSFDFMADSAKTGIEGMGNETEETGNKTIKLGELAAITNVAMRELGMSGAGSMLRLGGTIGLVVTGLLVLLRTARTIFAALQDGAERVSNDLQVMRTRATDAWNATIKTAAIPYFEGLEQIFQAITRDLREHGLIWATTTIVLTGIAQIAKGILVTIASLVNAAMAVKEAFVAARDVIRDWATSLRDALANATGIRFKIGQLPWPTTPLAPPPAGRGRPTRDIERDIERGRDALAAQAQLSQELLDTEEQRARVLVGSARARGNEIGAAQLQRQMELSLLALQREQNLNRMEAVQRQRQLLEELEPGISAQKRSQDEAKRALATEMEILAIQTDRVEMAEREARIRGDLAISLQRIAEIDRQIAMAENQKTAQAGLQIARLEEQRASELEIIGVRKTAEGLILLDQEQKLRNQLAIAEKQFGLNALVTEEIRSRLRINRALADTLDITTQIELRRAKALHELELERLTAQRIQQVYERQIQSQRLAAERRQLAIQGKALTPERESMELGRARVQADQDVLDLRHQQLAADVKSLEMQRQKALAAAQTQEEEQQINATYRNQTQALQDQIALIGEQSELLRDQARFIEDIPVRRQIQELGAVFSQGARNFMDEILKGGERVRTEQARLQSELAEARAKGDQAAVASLQKQLELLERETMNFGRMLKDLGAEIIQTTLRPMLEELTNSLMRALAEVGKGLGRFGALLPGIVGVALVAVGSLFDRQKAEVEALGENVKDNIEQVERVRGLIAGETTIAIASINESLKEALRETNSILREHTTYLRQIASQAGIALAPSTQSGGYSISAELIGSQAF